MTKPVPPHLKKKRGRPRLTTEEVARREALKKNKTTVPLVVENPVVEPVKTPETPTVTTLNDFPPPLPPLATTTVSPGTPAAAGGTPTLGDVELKSALAKTFQGSMKGLVRALNLALAKTKYEVDPIDIDADEAGLWSEFAAPVFKQYFPKFQDDPKIALAVVTGLILAGKVTVKKRSVPYVAESEPIAAAS